MSEETRKYLAALLAGLVSYKVYTDIKRGISCSVAVLLNICILIVLLTMLSHTK